MNTTHFGSTNLNMASFVDTNLADAIFSLNYASDPSTTLIGANFTNANLQGTTFADRTDLKNTIFHGANFKKAIFIGTKNLTPTQVKSACNWEQAIYNFDLERNYIQTEITQADRLASQKYIDRLKRDHSSDPSEPINCDRWN